MPTPGSIGVSLSRQARQELRLVAVIDESALMRLLGGPEVLTAQLVHLAEAAALPNVEVRVLTFESPHLGLECAYTIKRFPPELDEPDIVYHQYPFNEQWR